MSNLEGLPDREAIRDVLRNRVPHTRVLAHRALRHLQCVVLAARASVEIDGRWVVVLDVAGSRTLVPRFVEQKSTPEEAAIGVQVVDVWLGVPAGALKSL